MPGATDTTRVESEAGQAPVPTPPPPSETVEAAPAADGRRAKTIEVRKLNLFYGDFHAVENVTMTIAPNKVTALIGSSGCGKTTFLRSLNRMHELDAGAGVELVHAVERAQEGRLAAARGADQRRHLVRRDCHRHVLDRVEVAVEEVELAHLDRLRTPAVRGGRRLDGLGWWRRGRHGRLPGLALHPRGVGRSGHLLSSPSLH